MLVELSGGDIQTLLQSIEFSRERIRDADGTPYAVRQENLARLDSVAEKLRVARRMLT